MNTFEPKYEDDTHAVEYLPGRWYVCNALDKYSCLEIAQSISDEEIQDPMLCCPPFWKNRKQRKK